MPDPNSDAPINVPENIRKSGTIKLKPMPAPTPGGAVPPVASASAAAVETAAPAAAAPVETAAPAAAAAPVETAAPAAAAAPVETAAAAAPAASAADSAEPAIRIAPSSTNRIPGVKQTIRLRAPSPNGTGASEAKPAIKIASAAPQESDDLFATKPGIRIVPRSAEAPTGIPQAKPVETTTAPSKQTIQLKKPESSSPTVQLQKPDPTKQTIQLKQPESTKQTIQLKKPESSSPTVQLQKPEASKPTIQLKKPESSSATDQQPESGKPTIQLKKPESSKQTIQLKQPESGKPTIQLKKPGTEESSAADSEKKTVSDATIPPTRKLTLKLKNQPQPAQQKELPKNLIPGLNIPTIPPAIQKEETQEDAAQKDQPPVAEPVKTSVPVPEAPEDKKKKGKLPKVKKQKAPTSSSDEPNWFFLVLSCVALIAVCFIAYLVFAQYENMYGGNQIPIPIRDFLMSIKIL